MKSSRSDSPSEKTDLALLGDGSDGLGPSTRPAAGGCVEVATVALPLVLATASLTVTLFANRLFLSWYSQASVAAATPGGITYFTICSFFLGTSQYVNTIVAQYHGRGERAACARAVWQGVFFSAAAAPLILASIPLGNQVFAWGRHGETLVELEQTYFSTLMIGGLWLPLGAAFSSFFSGRGETSVVMWGNVAGNAVNVFLDYALIFGRFGFPEMGIQGAGIATAASGVIPVVYWAGAFLAAAHQPTYHSRREMRFDSKLFGMLLRYGMPAGGQFFLDVAAFTLFVILVGRIGEQDLAVANIVLSIEMLSFLPMVGMSTATATLVGQYIGRGQPGLAEESVRSALKLAMGYMGVMAVLFIAAPEFFIGLFSPGNDRAADFDVLVSKGAQILRLVAVYTLFDTLFIIYSGALKGAGDTRFAFWCQITAAWALFVPPVYIIIEQLGMGLAAAWSWAVVYVIFLGLVFSHRYRSGYWKSIRMIDQAETKRSMAKLR